MIRTKTINKVLNNFDDDLKEKIQEYELYNYRDKFNKCVKDIEVYNLDNNEISGIDNLESCEAIKFLCLHCYFRYFEGFTKNKLLAFKLLKMLEDMNDEAYENINMKYFMDVIYDLEKNINEKIKCIIFVQYLLGNIPL